MVRLLRSVCLGLPVCRPPGWPAWSSEQQHGETETAGCLASRLPSPAAPALVCPKGEEEEEEERERLEAGSGDGCCPFLGVPPGQGGGAGAGAGAGGPALLLSPSGTADGSCSSEASDGEPRTSVAVPTPPHPGPAWCCSLLVRQSLAMLQAAAPRQVTRNPWPSLLVPSTMAGMCLSPSGRPPCLMFLVGWYMTTTRQRGKPSVTARLRSPPLREAAATCEIRAWYHLWGPGMCVTVLCPPRPRGGEFAPSLFLSKQASCHTAALGVGGLRAPHPVN